MPKADTIIYVDGDFSMLEKHGYKSIDRIGRRMDETFAGVNSRKFTQPLGRITGSVSEFDKSMEAANARVLAFGASTGVIVAIQRAMRGLASVTLEVEKAMKDINVVMNLSDESLNKFKNTIFDIARNTGQQFADVAEATKELSRQGLGAEETAKRLNSAMILTRLSGMETMESVEALTAALNSYTKVVLNATDVVNMFATVDAAFAVSSRDLAQAVQRVGSSAEDAGVSIQELTALVTSAQQITARGGSVIGNSFKTIFTRLQRPQVLNQLEQLGVSVRDAAGQTRSAINILEDYVRVYDNLTPALKSSTDEMIGSVFQINQLKAIIKDLGNEYGAYQRALELANDSTLTAIYRNRELKETFAAQLGILKNNVAQLASGIGEQLVQSDLRNVLDKLNEMFGVVNGEDAGGEFGRGIIKGIGNFLAGPGIVSLLIAAAGVTKQFVSFAQKSFRRVIETFNTSDQRIELEKRIGKQLLENDGYMDALLSGSKNLAKVEQEILRDLVRQSSEIEKQASFRRAIAGRAISSGAYTFVDRGGVMAVMDNKKYAAGNSKSNSVRGFAKSPLAEAVEREIAQTGLPQSKIRVGKDPRLITPENPLGLGVYNTRDEPRGLTQGIEREKMMGNDPTKSGIVKSTKIPTFADSNSMFQIGNIIPSDVSAALDKIKTSSYKASSGLKSIEIASKNFFQNVNMAGMTLNQAYNAAVDQMEAAGVENAKAIRAANMMYDTQVGIMDEANKAKTKQIAEIKSNIPLIQKEHKSITDILESKRKYRNTINKTEMAFKSSFDIDRINRTSGKINATQADLIQKIEDRSRNRPTYDIIGRLRDKSKLNRIGNVNAAVASSNISRDFSDRFQGKAFVASIAAPMIAGIASEFINSSAANPESRGTRGLNAGLSGVGNIVSLASTGAVFGGPMGALGGALGGVLLTSLNVFTELNDIIPELNKNINKINEDLTAVGDLSARFDKLQSDLRIETDPAKRVELQVEARKVAAEAVRRGLILDENKKSFTNTTELTKKLSEEANLAELKKSVALFNKNPNDTSTRETLLAQLFGIDLGGGELFQKLGNIDESGIDLDKVNNYINKLSEIISIKNLDDNLFGGRFTLTEDFQKNIKGFLEALKIDKKIIDIIGKDEKILKLIFDNFKNAVEAAKSLEQSFVETSESANRNAILAQQINNSIVKFNRSIDLTTALSAIKDKFDNAQRNFAGRFFSESLKIEELFFSPRTKSELSFLQGQNTINLNQQLGLQSNVRQQKNQVNELIKKFTESIKVEDFQGDGREAIQSLYQRLFDFDFDSKNFTENFKKLQDDIFSIITSPNLNDTFTGTENNQKIISLLQNISETERSRLQNDEELKFLSQSELEQSEKIFEQTRKFVDLQQRLTFGGGLQGAGNISSSLGDSLRQSIFGNNPNSLNALIQTAKTFESFGIEQPFREEIISKLTSEQLRNSEIVGRNLSPEEARKLATEQYDRDFVIDKEAQAIANSISSEMGIFVNQLDESFKALETTISNLPNVFSPEAFEARIARSRVANLESKLSGDLSKEERQKIEDSIASLNNNISILEANLKPQKIQQSTNPQNDKSDVLDSGPINRVVLKDTESQYNALNDRIKEHNTLLVALSKYNEKLMIDNNRQIGLNRELYSTGQLLTSTLVDYNSQLREQLVIAQKLSGGKAFAANLFETLNANATDFQVNTARFGVELGTEIKDSFKGAISSMTRDISNFEQAAKQAFISILNKVTDYGVGQFVDQSLGLVTRAVKPSKFADGGLVTGGSGVKDDVPAILQGGEYVIKKSVVDQVGSPFLEGLNKANGTAAAVLKNAFDVKSRKPKSILDGELNVNPNLSAFALTNEDNPQNQRRFNSESEFLRYLESLRGYEENIERAMSAYRKQKRSIITQGFLSAFFNFAAFGLSKIPKGKSGSKMGIDPAGEIGRANGGMTKDTMPALVQGGEFIVQKKAVERFGKGFFDRLNQGQINPRKFATGGYVDSNNTSFIQPTGNQGSYDFSRIENSIIELSNSINRKNEQPQQQIQPQPQNNISIVVNVESDGSTSVNKKSDNQNDNLKGQKLAEMMELKVLEVINQQKKYGGLLYTPN